MRLKNHHLWVCCLIGLGALSAILLGGDIGLRAYGQPEQAFVTGDVASIRTFQSFQPLFPATDEATATITPTTEPSSTPNETHTPTTEPGSTPTDTQTPTPSATATTTPTQSASPSETATLTETPSQTPTPTTTPTSTSTSTPTPTHTATASPTLPSPTPTQIHSYLPLFVRNFPSYTSGISGRVTYKGKGVGNIKLDLRYYDGQAWQQDPVKQTLTRSDGLYLFDGINSLGEGKYYHVRFGPNNDDRFVYVWYTRALASLTPGELTHGGDFDIADIELTDPEPGGTLAVPVTFKWLPRGIGDEVYQVWIIDAQSRFVWSSEPPVASDSYTLFTLPNNVHGGQPYRWYIVAYSGQAGYGESLYYRDITFISSPQ